MRARSFRSSSGEIDLDLEPEACVARAAFALHAHSSGTEAPTPLASHSEAMQLSSPTGPRQLRGNSGRVSSSGGLADEIEVEVRPAASGVRSCSDQTLAPLRGSRPGLRSGPHAACGTAHENAAVIALGHRPLGVPSDSWKVH